MKTTISSRELLAVAGIATEEKPEIPADHLHLLITSVIKFVPARKLQQALNSTDTVSLRDVLAWQHATREWLGLPEAGRGKPSKDYRNEVKKWLRNHGNPTLEDIDAGWVPADKLENNSLERPKLSPRCQNIMEEFRSQLASLNAAKDDDEVRHLMGHYINQPKEGL